MRRGETATVLISGAMGATAQNVIEHLQHENIQIVAGVHNYDHLSNASRKTLQRTSKKIVSLDTKSHIDFSDIDILFLIPPSSSIKIIYYFFIKI